MFDNLREQANSSPFYEEEAQFQEAAGTAAAPPSGTSSSRRLLGMTGPQRFFIALMLMFMVCIVGALILLVTGKISLF
jgi:hypothetical protein